jgi:ketose-bisphosphate aldolase
MDVWKKSSPFPCVLRDDISYKDCFMQAYRFKNVCSLKELLPAAERGQYAVGSFSPRADALILPVLRAAQQQNSPLIVQIARLEFQWMGNTPESFAAEFYRCLEAENIRVPVGLHLDHTQDFEIIQRAIAAGFTSVMIDASALPLSENIAATRRVVEYAHARGVAVEGELGRIASNDQMETDDDAELYTVPAEAEIFARETGVDALAVSVGTVHGVYTVRQPTIDYPRLMAIRTLTPVHLVLHGGSGTPAEMMRQAYRLPGGGVSKINIATDLELAALAVLGRGQRLTDAELSALPPEQLALARAAVQNTTAEKMSRFLESSAKVAAGSLH